MHLFPQEFIIFFFKVLESKSQQEFGSSLPLTITFDLENS